MSQDNFTTPKQPTSKGVKQEYADEGLDKIITYIVIYANIQNYNSKMISDVVPLNLEAATGGSTSNADIGIDEASNYLSKTFPIFSDKAKLGRKDLLHSPQFTFSFSKTDDPNLRAGRYAYRNDGFVAIVMFMIYL